MYLFPPPFKYVIDTSALIDLKNNYPPEVFKNTVWRDIDSFFESKIIISVHEVYLELKKGSDFLSNWVDTHQECFLYPDHEECKIVQDLQDSYENFVEINKNGPHADPWVIACAVKYELTIIQHEMIQNNKQKLPFVAKEKHVEYIKIPQLLKIENLVY
jgi:hypothetical protein